MARWQEHAPIQSMPQCLETEEALKSERQRYGKPRREVELPLACSGVQQSSTAESGLLRAGTRIMGTVRCVEPDTMGERG